jgi:hypothetical protein
MIKFFRKIRQKLITNNKFSAYLLYALGEIILVVFGILIAVWINSTYENSVNNRIERDLLAAINSEYLKNQVSLERVIKVYRGQMEDIMELNSFISPKPENMSDEMLDHFILAVGSIPDYSLSREITNSIYNSGKMSLISNKEIGYLIAANSQYYGEYLKWIALNEKQVYEHIIPYISDKYPIKRVVDLYNNEHSSAFEIKKNRLLSDMRFESMVSNRILDIQTFLETAEELLSYQKQVIELIENELK